MLVLVCMCFDELSVIGEMFSVCSVGGCVCCDIGDMGRCIELVGVYGSSIKSIIVLKQIVLVLV